MTRGWFSILYTTFLEPFEPPFERVRDAFERAKGSPVDAVDRRLDRAPRGVSANREVVSQRADSAVCQRTRTRCARPPTGRRCCPRPWRFARGSRCIRKPRHAEGSSVRAAPCPLDGSSNRPMRTEARRDAAPRHSAARPRSPRRTSRAAPRVFARPRATRRTRRTRTTLPTRRPGSPVRPTRSRQIRSTRADAKPSATPSRSFAPSSSRERPTPTSLWKERNARNARF